MLEKLYMIQSLIFGIADTLNEILDRRRRITPAAQSAQGRHTRVVPAIHQTLLHELEKFALTHHGIGEVQTVELYLSRAICLIGKLFHEILIQRINLPLVAGAPVRSLDDTVHDRVAEVHVVARHVDFGTEHHAPFLEFTGIHLLEKLEILLDRTVAIGTCRTGSGR